MNRLFMWDSQSCATLSNHRPHTPNEQESGSSPLVGSPFCPDLQDEREIYWELGTASYPMYCNPRHFVTAQKQHSGNVCVAGSCTSTRLPARR